MAIWGHRDLEKFKIDTSKIINEGNFREILRYRAQGDFEISYTLKFRKNKVY